MIQSKVISNILVKIYESVDVSKIRKILEKLRTFVEVGTHRYNLEQVGISFKIG